MTGPERSSSLARISWHRFTSELLQFRRTREALFFTVAFPPVMLLLFGTIFGDHQIGDPRYGVSFAQYFVPGMIGSGIWGACFQNVAVTIPLDRDIGALKRLAATPMPKTAYFIGKVGLILVITLAQCALLLLMGVTLYHLRMPSAAQWLTFTWVLVLGVSSCTLLGLAGAGVIRNGRVASAVVTPFAIILQFLSGVYFVYGDLPPWLQTVGAVFPLRWITVGMRSVFLPEDFRLVEPGHSWQHPLGALVLLAWCVLGLLATLRTFRWTS